MAIWDCIKKKSRANCYKLLIAANLKNLSFSEITVQDDLLFIISYVCLTAQTYDSLVSCYLLSNYYTLLMKTYMYESFLVHISDLPIICTQG